MMFRALTMRRGAGAASTFRRRRHFPSPLPSGALLSASPLVPPFRSSSSDAPYGAPSSSADPPRRRRKVTALSLAAIARSKSRRITMCTAYDHPSALHVDLAGMDVLLVGDSLAMVALGYDTTIPVTLDEIIHHCRAVGRAEVSCLSVADMPFGSYEGPDPTKAMENAYRLLKEGGVDAVKLEGGGPDRCRTVKALVGGGIAVMGHVGLTPQAIGVLGGFRAQGRTAKKARRLLDEALALQDAGAFAVVLECVPSRVAAAITEALEVPTIGIGAGSHTSGQVLVYHDMLGMTCHPQHNQFVPKFCKRYASVGTAIARGLREYKTEVEEGTFPSEEYSPYKMSDAEGEAFDRLLEQDREERKRQKGATSSRLQDEDEYERLMMYDVGDDSGDSDNNDEGTNTKASK